MNKKLKIIAPLLVVILIFVFVFEHNKDDEIDVDVVADVTISANIEDEPGDAEIEAEEYVLSDAYDIKMPVVAATPADEIPDEDKVEIEIKEPTITVDGDTVEIKPSWEKPTYTEEELSGSEPPPSVVINPTTGDIVTSDSVNQAEDPIITNNAEQTTEIEEPVITIPSTSTTTNTTTSTTTDPTVPVGEGSEGDIWIPGFGWQQPTGGTGSVSSGSTGALTGNKVGTMG